jgi:hypothetical protein
MAFSIYYPSAAAVGALGHLITLVSIIACAVKNLLWCLMAYIQ